MRLVKDNLIELIKNENKLIQKSKDRLEELDKVIPLMDKNSKFINNLAKIIELQKVENLKNANEIIKLIDNPFNSNYSNSYILENSKVIDKYFEVNTNLINHIKNENYYNNKKTEFEVALELQRQIEQKKKDIENPKNDMIVSILSTGIFTLILIFNFPKFSNSFVYIAIGVLIFYILISLPLDYISNSIIKLINKEILKNLEIKHNDLISKLKTRDYKNTNETF